MADKQPEYGPVENNGNFNTQQIKTSDGKFYTRRMEDNAYYLTPDYHGGVDKAGWYRRTPGGGLEPAGDTPKLEDSGYGFKVAKVVDKTGREWIRRVDDGAYWTGKKDDKDTGWSFKGGGVAPAAPSPTTKQGWQVDESGQLRYVTPQGYSTALEKVKGALKAPLSGAAGLEGGLARTLRAVVDPFGPSKPEDVPRGLGGGLPGWLAQVEQEGRGVAQYTAPTEQQRSIASEVTGAAPMIAASSVPGGQLALGGAFMGQGAQEVEDVNKARAAQGLPPLPPASQALHVLGQGAMAVLPMGEVKGGLGEQLMHSALVGGAFSGGGAASRKYLLQEPNVDIGEEAQKGALAMGLAGAAHRAIAGLAAPRPKPTEAAAPAAEAAPTEAPKPVAEVPKEPMSKTQATVQVGQGGPGMAPEAGVPVRREAAPEVIQGTLERRNSLMQIRLQQFQDRYANLIEKEGRSGRKGDEARKLLEAPKQKLAEDLQRIYENHDVGVDDLSRDPVLKQLVDEGWIQPKTKFPEQTQATVRSGGQEIPIETGAAKPETVSGGKVEEPSAAIEAAKTEGAAPAEAAPEAAVPAERPGEPGAIGEAPAGEPSKLGGEVPGGTEGGAGARPEAQEAPKWIKGPLGEGTRTKFTDEAFERFLSSSIPTGEWHEEVVKPQLTVKTYDGTEHQFTGTVEGREVLVRSDEPGPKGEHAYIRLTVDQDGTLRVEGIKNEGLKGAGPDMYRRAVELAAENYPEVKPDSRLIGVAEEAAIKSRLMIPGDHQWANYDGINIVSSRIGDFLPKEAPRAAEEKPIAPSVQGEPEGGVKGGQAEEAGPGNRVLGAEEGKPEQPAPQKEVTPDGTIELPDPRREGQKGAIKIDALFGGAGLGEGRVAQALNYIKSMYDAAVMSNIRALALEGKILKAKYWDGIDLAAKASDRLVEAGLMMDRNADVSKIKPIVTPELPPRVVRDMTAAELAASTESVRSLGSALSPTFRELQVFGKKIGSFTFDHLKVYQQYQNILSSTADRFMRSMGSIPVANTEVNAAMEPIFKRFVDMNKEHGRLLDALDSKFDAVDNAKAVASKREAKLREKLAEVEAQITSAEGASKGSKDKVNNLNKKADQLRTKMKAAWAEHEQAVADLNDFREKNREPLAAAKAAMDAIDADYGKTLNALAQKHGSVRVFLEVDGKLPDNIKLTAEEQRAADEIKKMMAEFKQALEDRGIKTREGDYITHYAKDMFPKMFPSMQAAESIRPVLNFRQRTGDRAWLPDAWTAMTYYLPAASKKIAFQPLIDKWLPETDPNGVNTYASPQGDKYAPNLASYINERLRQIESPAVMDTGYKVASGLQRLFYTATTVGSNRIAIKHLTGKGLDILATHGLGSVTGMTDLVDVVASRAASGVPQGHAEQFLKNNPEIASNIDAKKRLVNFLVNADAVTQVLGGEDGSVIRDMVHGGLAKMGASPELIRKANGIMGAGATALEPVKLSELWERGVNLLSSAARAEAQGLEGIKALDAFMSHYIELSHMAGPDKADFFKRPLGKAFAPFQQELIKNAEYKASLLKLAMDPNAKDGFGTPYAGRLVRTMIVYGAAATLLEKLGEEGRKLAPFGKKAVENALHMPFNAVHVAKYATDLGAAAIRGDEKEIQQNKMAVIGATGRAVAPASLTDPIFKALAVKDKKTLYRFLPSVKQIMGENDNRYQDQLHYAFDIMKKEDRRAEIDKQQAIREGKKLTGGRR